jgi:hypothetical protein
MTGPTRTDFWLKSSQPLTLADAARQLAGALGGVRLKWIERPLANQSHDFYFRLRGAGMDVELRCAGWQPELAQQQFQLTGPSAEEVMRRALAGTGGWTTGCGAGMHDARGLPEAAAPE